MPKYGTVSHILLQLVVAFVITLEISFLTKLMFMILKNSISKIYLFFLSEPREEFLLRVTSLAQLPNFEGQLLSGNCRNVTTSHYGSNLIY